MNEVAADFTKVVLHFVQKEKIRREEAAGKPPSLKLMAEDELTQLYQNGYTRALGLVRSLAPERLTEFKALYEPDTKRRDLGPLNYCLQDYFTGIRPGAWDDWNADSICYTKTDLQKAILLSIANTIDQRVGNALLVLQASLFDREMDTSDELLAKGHLRAAGAVSGVVLEAHLATVATGRGVAARRGGVRSRPQDRARCRAPGPPSAARDGGAGGRATRRRACPRCR